MHSLTWLDTILFYFLGIWNSELERMNKNKEGGPISNADSFIIVLLYAYILSFTMETNKGFS